MKKTFKITQLKKINKETVSQICSLMKQLIPQNNYFLLNSLSPFWFKKIIKNKSTKIFIALNQYKKIIGIITMISYFKTDGSHKVYVEDFVVDSNYRNKGIGKALIKKVIKTAEKMGANTIELTSNPSRKAANIFYQKIGFKIYETNYYKYQIKNNLKK